MYIYIYICVCVCVCVCVCDRPQENWPSSHLGMILEIPILISITTFARVRSALLSRIVFIDILNLI